jgi:putative molybdopterin biosynthesis protein
MRVQSNLAKIRQARGLSVAALASEVGVKRQTIYAIESGRYIPNTQVALRLAQVLETSVEQLFHMNKEPDTSSKTIRVDLLEAPSALLLPVRSVRLGQVGQHMIAVPASPILAELPAADAILVAPGTTGKSAVQLLNTTQNFADRLVIAGCDPAMPVLAQYLSRHEGIEALIVGCSSLQALKWLKNKKIHIAGTHLRNEVEKESSLTVVNEVFPRGGYRAVTFAVWEEGLVVAGGNPNGICSVADLARRDLKIINREVGSGSRFLLDSLLKKEGISSRAVCGYENETSGHVLAAWHVQSGQADCCIATRAAARAFNLDFISLATERYDLVISEQHWDLPAVQAVLDAMNRSSFQRELVALGGYDTSQTGRLLN